LIALQEDIDEEWLMIDSTAVKAHQHAHGAKKTWESSDPALMVEPPQRFT
jgi:hypothetical protein